MTNTSSLMANLSSPSPENLTNTSLLTTGIPMIPEVTGRSSAMYTAARIINLYISNIVLLIGFLSNIVILALMRRKPVCETSFSVYFTAIACTDNLLITHYVVNTCLSLLAGIQYKYLHVVSCAVVGYITKWCDLYSNWLVCSLALERAVAVMAPFKSKIYINKRNAIKIILVILIVTLILESPHLWMNGIVGKRCTILPQYRSAQIPGRWTNTTLLFYLPFLVVVVCNIIILAGLSKAKKIRKNMSNDKPANRDNYAPVAVGISLAFLVFVFPNTVYYGLRQTIPYYRYPLPETTLMAEVFALTKTFNYACNLLLYVITSRSLRKSLCQMMSFCCHCRQGTKKMPVKSIKTTPSAVSDSNEANVQRF